MARRVEREQLRAVDVYTEPRSPHGLAFGCPAVDRPVADAPEELVAGDRDQPRTLATAEAFALVKIPGRQTRNLSAGRAIERVFG